MTREKLQELEEDLLKYGYCKTEEPSSVYSHSWTKQFRIDDDLRTFGTLKYYSYEGNALLYTIEWTVWNHSRSDASPEDMYSAAISITLNNEAHTRLDSDRCLNRKVGELAAREFFFLGKNFFGK